MNHAKIVYEVSVNEMLLQNLVNEMLLQNLVMCHEDVVVMDRVDEVMHRMDMVLDEVMHHMDVVLEVEVLKTLHVW